MRLFLFVPACAVLSGVFLTTGPALARPAAQSPETTAIHKRFAAKDAVIADLRRRLTLALAENTRLKQAAPRSKTAIVSSVPLTKVPVVFTGGHDTDPRDGGRPVTLVAGALGVPPDVFRAAFSRVRPAAAGEQPDPQQVRKNKAALLATLGPYGITNERLDTVSDYYRYVRSRNELWPTKAATAYALVRGGTVTGFVVTSGGSGYSSPPSITVPGVSKASGKATLSFSPEAEKNGAVAAIAVTP